MAALSVIDAAAQLGGTIDDLSAAGRVPDKNGMTRAGYEYQKHMGRGEFPTVRGRELNDTGQALLDDILTAPGTRAVDITSARAKGGVKFIRPDGVSATFLPNGDLFYFGV
jgi:hypothetical protein